jgi:DnaJ-class molecular chaperone
MNELAKKYNFSTVSKISDTNALKALFRKLMREIHPDANKENDTTELAKELNAAYEILVKNKN